MANVLNANSIIILRRTLLLLAFATARLASAAGSDESDLFTRRRVAPAGGRVTNVLVVTTTVRVLNRVHRHTTNARPRVPLGLVLVVRSSGFEHRLIDPATARNNANRGTS